MCRYHLMFEVSRKAPKDFELHGSCALDFARDHPEGSTLREVGELLGMTREGSRYSELSALAKIREAGIDWEQPPEHFEHWSETRSDKTEGGENLDVAINRSCKKRGVDHRSPWYVDKRSASERHKRKQPTHEQ